MFKKSDWVNAEGSVRYGKVAATAVAGIVALVLIFGSFGTVAAGERGIRLRFGAVVGAVDPGLYLKLPIVESVSKMNVQTQTIQYDSLGSDEDGENKPLFAASKDLQDVYIATVVNYHVDPEQVNQIFQQYRSTEAYRASVIEPIVRDSIKSVASQYTAEELVTKRVEFNDKVTALLTERLSTKLVALERVNITNFEFSKAYTEAIEAKVTAQQNAETAKNKLEQVKFEADQRIAQARGEAEAIRIQAQAITQQGGEDYVRLKAIEKWNGQLPQQFIPGQSVPFLNVLK